MLPLNPSFLSSSSAFWRFSASCTPQPHVTLSAMGTALGSTLAAGRKQGRRSAVPHQTAKVLDFIAGFPDGPA